jgi:outer membrane protein OmpA-like peptidoglycan-associated protein
MEHRMLGPLSLRSALIHMLVLGFAGSSLASSQPPLKKFAKTRTYSLWFRTDGGLYSLNNDADLKDTGRGSGFSLASGMAFKASSLGLSAGLGWTYSSISVQASDSYRAENLSPQGKAPSKLDTSFAHLDLGLSYHVNPSVQLGASILLPFGADTRFTIREDEDDSLPYPFAGLDFKFTPSKDRALSDPSWWYGVHVLRDLTIPERSVWMAMASVNYDIPVHHRIETPKVVYKTRYKLREEIVKNIKDRHFISLGLINFNPDSSKIPDSESLYLTAVAQYLAEHSHEWQAVLVGFNKVSFDENAKALLQRRLAAVGELLQRAGISRDKIDSYDLVKQDSSSPFDSVDSIDISLVGERNVETLKNNILHLMQRFAIPDTCADGHCI